MTHGKDRVRLAVPGQLIGQEDDAEGDRRLDRRRGHMDEAERRRSEGDRVGDGEGGDGGDQCPHARTSRIRQSTNRRWSVPSRMCSMPRAP